MCASCIAAATPGVTGRSGVGRVLLACGQAALALAIVWTGFFLIGRTLLRAPYSFHEGTVWRENWWE